MRVAVVGAGLSGLGCARRLAAAGHAVTVFEKSRGLGGRIASRRVDGTIVDHGAPALDVPAGTGLAALVDDLLGAEAVRIAPVVRGTAPPDAPMERPVGVADGLTRLAKRMAADLDVVRGVRVAALRGVGDGYELGDEQGNGHGRYDAVVVSAPAPQAADLLERSPEPAERVAALRALRYHPAVMLLAGIRMDTGAADVLVHPGDGVLAAVSVQGYGARDGAGPVPAAARLTPERSAEALDAWDDEAVRTLALPALAAALGGPVVTAWTQVKRWRYCTVSHRASFAEVNPPGSRIVLCGDAVSPPGMAAVYESGLRAADRVQEVR